MSKTFTRVFLTVLISLGIVVGTYMTVQAASSTSAATNSLGGYVHNFHLSASLNSQFTPENFSHPDLYHGDKSGGKEGCESKGIDPGDL